MKVTFKQFNNAIDKIMEMGIDEDTAIKVVNTLIDDWGLGRQDPSEAFLELLEIWDESEG